MKPHLYILSGLGADERVFAKIDFSNFEVTHINWIIPVANETIEKYAQHLTEQIKSTNPTLIGLSFGGMMAVEISKLIKTQKIILISSAKTYKELPIYFRWIGYVGLHKLVPIQVYTSINFMVYWFLGLKTKSDKKLYKSIIKSTNHHYLLWAVDKIVNWKNEFIPENLLHIHGTNDKTLPHKFLKTDILVKNGGHFMIYNKSTEISNLLLKEL